MNPLSRILFTVGLLMLGHLPTTASACSCVKVKETPATVRAWAERIFSYPGNIVLLRVTSVASREGFREQLNLEVVDAWKGSYAVGSVVRSDTADVRGGMCEMSLVVGELYLAVFEAEPITIGGCRVDGGVTELQRKHLDRFADRRHGKSLESTRAE
jgi:hypothetical protein